MAEITEHTGTKAKSKQRAKKQSTKVDMTPMVDLAFLLLTFFVLTSTFSKPKSMELSLPAADGPPVKIKKGITFLLTKHDKVFYYLGEFYPMGNAKGLPPTQLKQTSFDQKGLHELLVTQNKWAIDQIQQLKTQLQSKSLTQREYDQQAVETIANTNALTALIKTDEEASYKNAIDLLDELKICNVGKRVLGVDMMAAEYQLLQETRK